MELAHDWIEDAVRQHQLNVVGPIDQHQLRPWSAVLLAQTNAGNLFFKASADVIGFEPALTEAIYRWKPKLISEVLAYDAEHRWMLKADGGHRLKEVFKDGLEVENWTRILRDYADLQITLAPHSEELLTLGVRDRRLSVLPDLYRDLLEDRDWLLLDQSQGISSSEYEILVDSISTVNEMCDRLSGFNIPPSIHHNDLHDGNIFVNEDRFLFFDWGDSSVSHPFFSLRTAFVSVENTFGLEEDHPIFETLASAYLDTWSDHESMENLWQAFALAKRLWALSSAIKYWTIFAQLESSREEYKTAVPGLLKEFLELNPDLGSTYPRNNNKSHPPTTPLSSIDLKENSAN